MRESLIPGGFEKGENMVDPAFQNAKPGSSGEGPSVVELFAREAAVRAEESALLWGESSMTYLELRQRASALAEELRRLGVGDESPVGILTGRTPELVIGALGVLEAGGAYVPLDPASPEERLAWILDDVGARQLVTGAACREVQEGLDRRRSESPRPVLFLDARSPLTGGADEPDAPMPSFDPLHLAYVIYTSGSTGRPKGVQVSHGALANLAAWHRRTFEIGPEDRASLVAGVGFDASVWEIWPYLSAGASLCIVPEEIRTSPAKLRDWLLGEGVTIGFVPTPLAEGLIELTWPQNESVPRFLLTGGDRLRRFSRADLPFRLINNYGPTENAVVTTSGEVAIASDSSSGQPSADTPSIGREIDGVGIRIVDGRLEPVEDGTNGELVIAGKSLARGYLGHPGRTAASFVPDPFSDVPGTRLYKTGDVCRCLVSGEIDFVGRVDDQVKVRGHRIELGEIEAALMNHRDLHAATVVAYERPSGTHLVGYFVADPDAPEELSSQRLREYLGNSLPSPMIPSLFLPVDEMPLTPNGKIDRKAFPMPEDLAELAVPTTPTERYLLDLWKELFGHGAIGVDSDFFELGGHSLIIAQLCARIREHLGVELHPKTIFETPTVELLAEYVDRSEHGEPIPPIRAVDRDRKLLLSFAQERVWFLQELVPSAIAYNSQLTLRLRGRLDVDRLGRAFSEIVRRHEILRTVFVMSKSGHPVQQVEPPFEVVLPVTDLRDCPEEEREAKLEALVREEIAKPFDLGRLPLARWLIYRLGEEENVLLQVEHHFLHDGWAVSVLLQELKDIYTALVEGRDHGLPERPIQYVDFALWQRDWLQGEALERQIDYWRRRLEGAPPVLELPFDRPRPERSSLRGDALELVLPQEIYRDLRAMSRRRGYTLFILMLSAMYALLERLTGRRDLVLGSGMANRRLRELEGMIGMVVNTIPMRTDLGGDPSVETLWSRVRETVMEAQVHQDIPFEKLVEALRPSRDLSLNPIVQTLFSFHDAPVPDLQIAGLRSEIRYLNNGSAKTDLNVIGIPRAEQRRARGAESEHRMAFLWEYNQDLFDRTTMLRFWNHYVHLLAAMVENPGRPLSALAMLSAAERLQVRVEWNDTVTSYPAGATIDGLVAEQAKLRGDTVAVVFGDRSLTYAELDRQADHLARCLRHRGVGAEVAVALYAERSLEIVVALLAILKAGGAYVPLDLASPGVRLEAILEEVAPPVILTQAHLVERLPSGKAEVILLDSEDGGDGELPPLPERRAWPDSLAYVIYTSGSTGRPKGVAVSHRAVLRLVRETDAFDVGPERIFLQFAPISFDASTLELWGPLTNGGRLVLYPAAPASLDDLARIVDETGVDTLWLTAGLFHQLSDEHLDRMQSLRQLLAGGDVLLPGGVEKVLEKLPRTVLINGYGPTENTTFTCCHPMRDVRSVGRSVPIGRPIPNTTAILLDPLLRLLPPGVVGELFAGGAGLARGYFNQPRETAERFIPEPDARQPGARLYRTGDLAQHRPDGRIDFFGRRDFQVKVRGFRIELGEIESALERHPAVRQTVVLAPRDAFGDRRLVAYWAPEGGAEATRDELQGFLESSLPDFQVPSIFMRLEELPLNPNGKVDRKALPEPDAREGAKSTFEPPRSETSKLLASLWAKHLDTEKIGLNDSFFDLGGHSLLAIRILTRIREEFAVELSLQEFLEATTIARLEKIIEARQLEIADDDLVSELLKEIEKE